MGIMQNPEGTGERLETGDGGAGDTPRAPLAEAMSTHEAEPTTPPDKPALLLRDHAGKFIAAAQDALAGAKHRIGDALGGLAGKVSGMELPIPRRRDRFAEFRARQDASFIKSIAEVDEDGNSVAFGGPPAYHPPYEPAGYDEDDD